MANHSKALDLDNERAAMIEKARPFIIKAFKKLGDREVSLGEITAKIDELYPNKKTDTGMGIVPTVLDELERTKVVTCIETPVDPTKNGHIIGMPDWRALTYRLAEPQGAVIEH